MRPLTHQQIADLMTEAGDPITGGGVRFIINRALAKLRDELGESPLDLDIRPGIVPHRRNRKRIRTGERLG